MQYHLTSEEQNANYFSRLGLAFGLVILESQRLPSGYNEVYKLKTDRGIKALKISDKNKEHILFEHNFLKSLVEYGFDIVPLPLQVIDKDSLDDVVGDTIAVIDHNFFSIFNWLEGDNYNGSNEHLFSAGINLAKYHKVAGSILEERLQAKRTDYQSIRSEWGDLVVRYTPLGTDNA